MLPTGLQTFPSLIGTRVSSRVAPPLFLLVLSYGGAVQQRERFRMLAIAAKRKADKRIRWLAFFAAKKKCDVLLVQLRSEIERATYGKAATEEKS